MVKEDGRYSFHCGLVAGLVGDAGINDIIKERVGAEAFLQTLKTLKRGSDHLSALPEEAAAYWMDTAAKFIASNKPCPFAAPIPLKHITRQRTQVCYNQHLKALIHKSKQKIIEA